MFKQHHFLLSAKSSEISRSFLEVIKRKSIVICIPVAVGDGNTDNVDLQFAIALCSDKLFQHFGLLLLMHGYN